MPRQTRVKPHKKSLGLFGRTFLFVTIIMVISLVIWSYMLFNTQTIQRAEQLADRSATALSISEKSLSYVPKEDRASLVIRLATPGDTQIFPRKLTDVSKPLSDDTFWDLVHSQLRQKLPSPNQIIASEVNSKPGLWLSITTADNDAYWLLVRHEFRPITYLNELLKWAIVAICLALVIASLVWQIQGVPLKLLAKSASKVARGETPPDLPTDKGPPEICELFQAFNHMVHELRQADSDQEIMLAGISHDLRTPLARMRLEIELSSVSEETRNAIDGDLEQIDHCIAQLMEYASPAGEPPKTPINVSQLIEEQCHREQNYTEFQGGHLSTKIKPDLYSVIKEINLRRIVGNLIENARRYGKDENGNLKITVNAYDQGNKIYIDVADEGLGVNPKDMNRLLRPFTRGESARTNASGAGLGLAICDRLLRQTGGSLSLHQNQPHGLLCRIEIPKYRAKSNQIDNDN